MTWNRRRKVHFKAGHDEAFKTKQDPLFQFLLIVQDVEYRHMASAGC